MATATVVFHSCFLDDHIPASGWTFPDSVSQHEAANLTFGEFNSTGPGARATRPFPAQVLTAAEASKFTVATVLKGWDPLIASQQP